MTQTILFILLCWNITTFAIMMVDKARAERDEYRISEKTLFTLAFLLGGFGIGLGMLIFRHKTKHLAFKILIPVSIIINIIEIILIFKTNLFF